MSDIKIMHWVERFDGQGGGMRGKSAHWNRLVGYTNVEAAREDADKLRKTNPPENVRIMRVTEEVLP